MPILSGQVGRYGVMATPDILGPHRGIPWRSPALSNAAPTITGVTRNSTGAVLGSCTVWAMNTQTDTVMGTTISDSNGVFSLTLYTSGSFYLVAYKGLVSSIPTQLSLTRSSAASYFDSSGVVQTASINTARFNYRHNGTSWVQAGLLVEDQRTNSCFQSFAPANASWINASAAKAGGLADLLGGINGQTVTASAGAGTHTIEIDTIGTLTSGNTYTIRVYIGQGTSPYVVVGDFTDTGGFVWGSLKWSDLSTAVSTGPFPSLKISGPYFVGIYAGTSIYAVDLSWVRFGTSTGSVVAATFNASAATLSDLNTPTYTAAGTETFKFYGAMVYDGSSRQTIAPILTTTAAVTRSADILSSTNATLLAAQGWVIEVGEATTATASTLLGINTVIGLGETAANALTTADGGAQTTANTGTWTSQNRGALAWDSTPRVSISLDGGTVVTAANTAVTPTALYFGNTNNGASGFLNGHIRSIWAFSTLTDGQLQTFSTVGVTASTSSTFAVTWAGSDVSGTTLNTLIPT